MPADTATAEFERIFLPHLDAAWNLARLLLRNTEDAEDVVQESYLKALRAFPSFRGDSARPWLLAIVRNTCFTWLRNNRGRGQHREIGNDTEPVTPLTPEKDSLDRERARLLELCIRHLPSEFREALILREMEDLSYEEIAGVMGVPRGTVMSRLSRARARLAQCLNHPSRRSAFAESGR